MVSEVEDMLYKEPVDGAAEADLLIKSNKLQQCNKWRYILETTLLDVSLQ